ncbi:MAG TPA: hypothetical protein DCZ10_09240 [Pelotomaculum sp.]|nr:hypothetical protein [Pelotomaculum sp.]
MSCFENIRQNMDLFCTDIFVCMRGPFMKTLMHICCAPCSVKWTFRPFFRESQKQARELSLYCGCIFSKEERSRENKEGKQK